MATEEEMLVGTPAIGTAKGVIISEAEEDYNAAQEFKNDLENMWRNGVAKMPDLNKLVFEEAYQETPLGFVILDIPLEIGNALMERYGQNCFADKDFVRFAQKAFDQGFLPSI